MKRLNKKNDDLLKEKKKRYLKLSDEQVIANFMQDENSLDKATNSLKEMKNNLTKPREKSICEDTMAYRINKSSFFLELIKEKEDSLQLVGN